MQLKKYWKNAISLILVVALLIGILPTAAHAQDALPTDLECDAQTGISTIYEYQPFDIGKAGTAYLNTYLSTLHVRRSDLSLGGNRLPVNIEFWQQMQRKPTMKVWILSATIFITALTALDAW